MPSSDREDDSPGARERRSRARAERQRIRMLRYALAFVAFVAVMIFAPRRTEPLLMCGMTFRTKTGQPGMTNVGFVLLVVVPLATYFVTGWLARAWQRWGRAERRIDR